MTDTASTLFLASGGMGEVWRATDVALGRVVAVKVLLPEALTDPSFGVRFRAEARTLAAFRHPNVVDVYDFGESPPATHGGIPRDGLRRRRATVPADRAAGRLPVAETLSVVAQAAEALHAAHASGVVHRDVKPGNLLVQADGTVVLVDFGVARSTALAATTPPMAYPARLCTWRPSRYPASRSRPPPTSTPSARSPTTAWPDTRPSTATPRWRSPCGTSTTNSAATRGHTRPVRALVRRALAKNPADRYQTAAALAAAARAAAAAVGGHLPGGAGSAATAQAVGLPTAPLAPPPPLGARANGTTKPDLPVVAAGAGRTTTIRTATARGTPEPRGSPGSGSRGPPVPGRFMTTGIGAGLRPARAAPRARRRSCRRRSRGARRRRPRRRARVRR